MSTLKSAASSVSDMFSSTNLVKAKLYRVKDEFKMSDSITVQFNPSEYTISRSVNMSKKQAIGRDPDMEKLQAISGNFATLSLDLYFDTITDLESNSLGNLISGGKAAMGSMAGLKAGVGSVVKNLMPKVNKHPNVVCKEIIELVKYNDESHSPFKVRFKWGNDKGAHLDFVGYIAGSTVRYTMFTPDGVPIRAKISLSIQGEETDLIQKKMSRTFCSPDRTKERLLTEGDPLWMMAQQEYSDPEMWKAIANANGILNPRALDHAISLKVPSIQ